MEEQLITRLKKGDVGDYVFLCGEPERVDKIVDLLGGGDLVTSLREFRVYNAAIGDTRVTVASTGVGGPSTAVLLEELANVGSHTFVRVGTSGGMGEAKKGDFVISSGAIRADGTTPQYAWPTYPAVAHHEVVLALIESAEKTDAPYHVGLTYSVDAFYAENKVLVNDDLASMSHGGYLLPSKKERIRDAIAMGAKHIEMENGTIFTLGGLFGLRTGSICTVSDVVPWHPTEEIINFEENITDCIRVGIGGMGNLIEMDRERGDRRYWHRGAQS